jgi:hypothetical protein
VVLFVEPVNGSEGGEAEWRAVKLP